MNELSDVEQLHLEEFAKVDGARQETWSETTLVMARVFGHAEFKGRQREIVDAALEGMDVLVIAPTGMGKSLCFQLPAVMAQRGITVIVSPLLALMKNQVESLRQKGVMVAALSSDSSTQERKDITDDLSCGNPTNRLLYITPEKLCTADFLRLLDVVSRQGHLNRLVVDEAHCISEWGHEFRNEYRRLGIFRRRFKDVPIMALTATATDAVQRDIVASLGMSRGNLHSTIHPFNRANLFYEIRYLSVPNPVSQMADVFEYITTLYRRRQRPSSGVIYCRTRATCDELSSYLRTKGLSARPYHRGISSSVLDRTLKDWTFGGSGDGGVDVVVATVAFGLGIDKADVRYILHYDLPRSFEGYYQETGRAGRDGLPAKCILYYSREDAISVRKWVASSHAQRAAQMQDGPEPSQRSIDSLSALIEYAEKTDVCRHVGVCRYFGEIIDHQDAKAVREYCATMCDVCKYPTKVKSRKSNLTSSDFVNEHRVVHGAHEEKEAALQKKHDTALIQATNRHPTRTTTLPLQEGSNKRAGSSLARDVPGKKPKATYAPSIVSKPFGSVDALRKPFKTPFRKPSIASDVAEQRPTEVVALETQTSSEDEVEVLDGPEIKEPSPTELLTPSSPIDIPACEMELDMIHSTKVPYSDRRETFECFRRALHRVFMNSNASALWTQLHPLTYPTPTRIDIISRSAREMERSIMSLCSTSEGYKRSAASTISGIKDLSRPEPWIQPVDDEWEDAAEIIGIMKRVCSEGGTKRKTRGGS